MAIPAISCYNSHTPISLGVSYIFVPIGIFPGVHPTMEVIFLFLLDDCKNPHLAFALVCDENIHIHLTRLLLHFLLMYRQQHLQLHLEEYLQTTMTFFMWQMGVYVIHIDYWRFPIFRLIEMFLIVPCGSWHSLVPW